jgi:hypothetical protein
MPAQKRTFKPVVTASHSAKNANYILRIHFITSTTLIEWTQCSETNDCSLFRNLLYTSVQHGKTGPYVLTLKNVLRNFADFLLLIPKLPTLRGR